MYGSSLPPVRYLPKMAMKSRLLALK